MSDLLHLVVMLAAGGLLAAVWLAGLWLEVRRLPGRDRPYAGARRAGETVPGRRST